MARQRHLFSITIQSLSLKVWTRKYRHLVAIAFFILLGLSFSLILPARSNENNALELARLGQNYYQVGQFDAAATYWQQAADAYQKAKDAKGMTASLINKSQALQNLGLYPKACNTLLEAFAIDRPDCNDSQINAVLKNLSQQSELLSTTQVTGLQGLGDVLRRQGRLEQSQTALKLALSAAPDASATLLSLGNTERAIGNRTRDRWDYEQVTEIIDEGAIEKALEPYQPALSAYRKVTAAPAAEPMTIVQSQLNYFSLLLDLQDWWREQTSRRIASWSRSNELGLIERSENFLTQLESNLQEDTNTLQTQIQTNIDRLQVSRSTVYARLNLAENLMRQKQAEGIEPLLLATLQQAQSIGDKRLESYALGYLGRCYQQQGKFEEAARLTRQALLLAQEQNVNGDAREIAYLWQSQLGRSLREKGDIQGAIAAYTAAFNTLQSLRNDLNANDRDVQFNFRQEVKPVYLALADLLLRSDLKEDELNSLVVFNPGSSAQNLQTKTPKKLELARQVIESMQLAELDNFFQDPCSETADIAVQIDDIDPQAAVIYPIVLPDRLEVILSLPGRSLRSTTIAIDETQVNQKLDELYDNLYNESIDNSAINIFRTVPLNSAEVGENLQKILPILTQVYDWLIRPFEAELESNQISTLAFVLNDRFQRVPIAALYDGQKYSIEKYSIALIPSLQLIDPKQLKRQEIQVLAAGVSEQTQIRGETFPALTNVPKELKQIEATFPNSKQLLNEQFTAETFQQQLERTDFSIVHLATHGLFSSDPAETFIITGDRHTIDIDRLSSLLKSGKTRSPELLVLSACETATGDERAVLGLAGVAVRSGARSTLATLWPVGDATTAQLMGEFYQALKEPALKKLDALKQAQIASIDSLKNDPPLPELKELPPHPYYWAPYVLVGNWL